MNREILFRGFHECADGKTVIKVDGIGKRGEWLYGCYCAKGYGCADFDCIEPKDDDEGFISYYNWEVIPSTVGQFTGLCDKNGKKIFEGDIFKTKHNDWKYIVTWQDDNSRYLGIAIGIERQICYVGMCDKNGKSAVEVIGNIWENSDLIGDESNV